MSDAYHAARLVQLEAALLSLMRAVAGDHDQHDGLTINVTTDRNGQIAIDITYMMAGFAVSGESL